METGKRELVKRNTIWIPDTQIYNGFLDYSWNKNKKGNNYGGNMLGGVYRFVSSLTGFGIWQYCRRWYT